MQMGMLQMVAGTDGDERVMPRAITCTSTAAAIAPDQPGRAQQPMTTPLSVNTVVCSLLVDVNETCRDVLTDAGEALSLRLVDLPLHTPPFPPPSFLPLSLPIPPSP
ncbi:hypothetical protein NQZ68_006038 [Dissostichus eleginoides]|nr:hypothetical protein NQZ68_006038 [Dissostichus eleginoides]